MNYEAIVIVSIIVSGVVLVALIQQRRDNVRHRRYEYDLRREGRLQAISWWHSDPLSVEAFDHLTQVQDPGVS